VEEIGERAGNNLSLWERTAQKFYTSPLSVNVTADVCVIGAGIAGVTTAYLLAHENRDSLRTVPRARARQARMAQGKLLTLC
jgi:hypothetical protein